MHNDAPFIEIRISPDQADEFVERLISDEEFRERVSGDRAAEALAEYGITVSPDLLADQVELPSPEEIQEVRAAMDTGELSPETTKFNEVVMFKFWPVFWWVLKFRGFRSTSD